MMGWGDGWGGWIWYWPMHMLGWLLVIVAAALIFRWVSGGRRDSRGGEDTAVAILRERYARGEIDQKEFDERMRFLKASLKS